MKKVQIIKAIDKMLPEELEDILSAVNARIEYCKTSEGSLDVDKIKSKRLNKETCHVISHEYKQDSLTDNQKKFLDMLEATRILVRVCRYSWIDKIKYEWGSDKLWLMVQDKHKRELLYSKEYEWGWGSILCPHSTWAWDVSPDAIDMKSALYSCVKSGKSVYDKDWTFNSKYV